jgi:hypothetical protein
MLHLRATHERGFLRLAEMGAFQVWQSAGVATTADGPSMSLMSYNGRP